MNIKTTIKTAILGLGLGLSGLASAAFDVPTTGCFGQCKSKESACMINAHSIAEMDACMSQSMRCMNDCFRL